MRARPFLSILLVLLLASAGCLGTTGSTPTGTESVTDSPSDSPTDSPATPPDFENATFEEGPTDLPERPDALSESAVAEYARTFEYRRAYNALWMGPGTDVNLECETHDVEPVDGGFDVLVSCTGYANSGGEEPNSTATSTQVHADWFTQYYVYRVTEDGTQRRHVTEDERSSESL